MELSVTQVAILCHEANRAYCQSIGDDSQPPWDEAPEWQQHSAINGVRFHLNNLNANAKDSHKSWYDLKLAEGWHYGPVKDEERKTHPCMVPYNELPIEQRIKDHIFRSVIHGAVGLAHSNGGQ